MLVFTESTGNAGGGRGTRFHEAHHSQSFSKSAQEFARQFGGPVNLDSKISHPKRRRKPDDTHVFSWIKIQHKLLMLESTLGMRHVDPISTDSREFVLVVWDFDCLQNEDEHFSLGWSGWIACFCWPFVRFVLQVWSLSINPKCQTQTKLYFLRVDEFTTSSWRSNELPGVKSQKLGVVLHVLPTIDHEDGFPTVGNPKHHQLWNYCFSWVCELWTISSFFTKHLFSSHGES